MEFVDGTPHTPYIWARPEVTLTPSHFRHGFFVGILERTYD
jgi:hypothetical protein